MTDFAHYLTGLPVNPDATFWTWLAGILIAWLIWSAAVVPIRRRRKRRYRSTWLQKKAVRLRHKGWRKEAKQVLKRLKKGEPAGEVQPVLQSMSPYAFEYLITEGFRSAGAKVRKIERVSGDGGWDGMVHLNGRWHLIQAKRYGSPVSRQVIEEFLTLCQTKRMPGLFVATNGFSKPARKLAYQSRRITLMDGNALVRAVRAK